MRTSVRGLVAVLVLLAKASASWRSILSTGRGEAASLSSEEAVGKGRVPDAQSLGISSETHAEVFSAPLGAMQAYASRPDCFRNVAVATKCEELENDSQARVRAAIEMTRCEIATAKQLPPLECSALTPTESLSACVEALSRSAQFWSSYSGYLREVTTLCHAFQQLQGLDEARSLYAALAHEKAALLGMLRGREVLWNEREKRERERAVQERVAWDTAKRAADSAAQQGTEAALRTQQAAKEVVDFLSSQTSTLDRFLAQFQTELGSHVDEQATALMSKLASAADDSIARTESSLAVKLAGLAVDHEASLCQSAESVDRILLKAMANVDGKATQLADALQSSLDLAQASRSEQFQAFDSSRNELHHLANALASLRSMATDTESSLAARVDLLAHVVGQQAEQAQEFKGIIASLAELLKTQKELLESTRSRSGWWNHALLGLLGFGPERSADLSTLGTPQAGWEDRVLSAVERIARTGWLQAVVPASAGQALVFALRGAAFSTVLSLRAGAFCLRYLLTLLLCTLALSCRAARPLWSRLLARFRRLEASLPSDSHESRVEEAEHRSSRVNVPSPSSNKTQARKPLIVSPLQAPPSRFPEDRKPSSTLSSTTSPSRSPSHAPPVRKSPEAQAKSSRLHSHPFDLDL